jgi:hypothetical protein
LPGSDPGGIKRAKMKAKTQPKDRQLGIKSIKTNVIGTGYRYPNFLM